MKILVATDGSEGSEKAIEFASKLAHESNSRLSIIHITPMLPAAKDEMITLLKDEIGSPKKAGKEYLASGKLIAEKFDLKPKLILKEGNPVEVILEEAGKYDMIVVGSYGKGKIDRFLLGSVSSKLICNSKIPVVVVR